MYKKYFVDYSIFFSFFSLGFILPIQVAFKNKHSPLLLTWIPILILFFVFKKRNLTILTLKHRIVFILYYFLVFLSNDLLYWINDIIHFSELTRLGYLYLFPVIFFPLGRLLKSYKKKINLVWNAIFFSSLINLLFMSYDNTAKMIFEVVPKYSKYASEHLVEVNKKFYNNPEYIDLTKRGRPRDRSLGLLDSSQISATFSAFSIIIFMLRFRRLNKLFYTTISFLMILLLISTMNYTVILTFLPIFYLLLFIARKKLSLKVLLVEIVIALFLLSLSISNDPDKFYRSYRVIIYQYNLILGTGGFTISYLDDSIDRIKSMYLYLYQNGYYYQLIFGDGFSEKALRSKGGDFGLVESMARYGVFGSVLVFLYLLILFKKTFEIIKKIDYKSYCYSSNELISILILFLIFFGEIHYSVYHSKSILPVVFFCIGILPRHSKINKDKEKHHDL